MLQEMKLEDALKKFLQGKKVLVMYDESLKNDGTEFIVEALEKMLERNRYLVDVPAIEDFEFKQEVEQMVKTEKSSTKAVKKKLVDLPKNKSKLDDCQEEIIQMLKDGKSQYAIAKELGVVQSTVTHWMARHGIDKQGNQKKCATCQYRETSPGKGGCDYIGKTDHRRGCSVENCDKYVEDKHEKAAAPGL